MLKLNSKTGNKWFESKLAASTQNQAFNALLFLFKYVLKKDRTLPWSKVLKEALQQQLDNTLCMYKKDLKAKYDSVFLFNSFEKKNKHAAKELVWQWFFPLRI